MSFQTIFQLFDFYVALNVAEALLCFRLPKRSRFWLRYFSCLALQLVFPVLKYFLPSNVYSLFGFALQYLVTIPSILFCFKANLMESLFCSSVGLCLQHITFALYFCLILFNGIKMNYIYHALIQVAFYLISYSVFYFCFLKPKMPKTICFRDKNYLMVWLVALTTPVITLLCVNSKLFMPWSAGGSKLIYTLTLLVSLIGMIAELELYASNLKTEENTAMKLLIQRDREEYQKIKNQNENISIRYHDLRHKLEAQEESGEVKDLPDTAFDTGDIALNCVLMEKSPVFARKNIRMTYFAEGLKLTHISEEERYSLFENAVMNAVEAVEKLEAEKRTISITAFRRGYFYDIRIENYYEGKILIVDGLPQTEKKGEGHGYGLKSMRMVAKKYGGKIDLSFGEDIFTLNILLPVG